MKYLIWSEYEGEDNSVVIYVDGNDPKRAAEKFVEERYASLYDFANECVCNVKLPGHFGYSVYRVTVESTPVCTGKLIATKEIN